MKFGKPWDFPVASKVFKTASKKGSKTFKKADKLKSAMGRK